jgi:hypothetical protein
MTPAQVWALWDGYRWRRSREAESLGIAVLCIANRIPFNERGLEYRDVVRAIYPDYEEAR